MAGKQRFQRRKRIKNNMKGNAKAKADSRWNDSTGRAILSPNKIYRWFQKRIKHEKSSRANRTQAKPSKAQAEIRTRNIVN
jgi:hypothetical protein